MGSLIETHEKRTETHACDCISRQVGDTIFREAAIDAFWKLDAELRPSAIDAVLDMLKNLPAAQPETAKRIVGKSRNGMTLWHQCDKCNEPVDAQDNFCRGCGRRLIDG